MRNYITAIIITFIMSSFFYAAVYVYRVRNTRPPQNHSIIAWKEEHPEFTDEIQTIAGALQDAETDEAAELFDDTSSKVYGGQNWVLLNVSAAINRNKEYTAFNTLLLPEVRLSCSAGSAALIGTIIIDNPHTRILNVPRVPDRIEWVFTDINGEQNIINADVDPLKDKGGDSVIRLPQDAFWGFNLEITKPDNNGYIAVAVRLVFTGTELDGFNVISGTLMSEPVEVAL